LASLNADDLNFLSSAGVPTKEYGLGCFLNFSCAALIHANLNFTILSTSTIDTLFGTVTTHVPSFFTAIRMCFDRELRRRV
jgi:hypothetical protein